MAILAGFLADYVTGRRKVKLDPDGHDPEFCCQTHEHGTTSRGMLLHSLKHSLKIVFFVFIVLFGFNYLKDAYGFETISRELLLRSDYAPLVAAFIGLIPGCGTSVVLATLYSQGLIGISAAFAGLSVASGDVILVLLGSKMARGKILRLMTYVLIVSALAGYLALYFGGK